MTDEEKREVEGLKAELAAMRAQLEEAKKGADPEQKTKLEAALAKVKELEGELTKSKGKGEIKGASEDSVHAMLETGKVLIDKLEKLKPAKQSRRWVGW